MKRKSVSFNPDLLLDIDDTRSGLGGSNSHFVKDNLKHGNRHSAFLFRGDNLFVSLFARRGKSSSKFSVATRRWYLS